MKYLLLFIPFFLHFGRFLENTKLIELNSGNAEVIHILESSRYDNIFNLIISLFITYLLLKKIKSSNNIKKNIINAIFIMYINELYILVSYIYISRLFEPMISEPYILPGALNLIPFKNISLIFYSKSTFIQVVGNALLLSPLAFFIHYYKWHNNYRKTFLTLFGLIAIIECTQFIQTYINSKIGRAHV